MFDICNLYPRQEEVEVEGEGKRLYFPGAYYIGEVKGKRPHGNGKWCTDDGMEQHEGEWLEGLPHGHGEVQYKDGKSYTGNFSRGYREGKGTYKTQDWTYSGFWKSGKMHGDNSTMEWTDGSGRKYIGDWRDGKMHGNGAYTFRNGDVYNGPFDKGRKHGRGTINLRNGGIYHGDWEYDIETGAATYTDQNGKSVIGNWDTTHKSFIPKKSQINK